MRNDHQETIGAKALETGPEMAYSLSFVPD
jgi:hypothetical protein